MYRIDIRITVGSTCLIGFIRIFDSKITDMKVPMTLTHRKNIVREAKHLINAEVKDYESLPGGQKESILDEYIDKLCVEKGWSLSHFYAEDGKVLNKILS